MLKALVVCCTLVLLSAQIGIEDNIERAAQLNPNKDEGLESQIGLLAEKIASHSPANTLEGKIDALTDRVDELNKKLRKPKKKQPMTDPTPFTMCPAYHPWFIFVCIVFTVTFLLLVKKCCFVVEEEIEILEKDLQTPKPGSLASQAEIQIGDMPADFCRFLRVDRSLENWQSKRCKAPPTAVKEDFSTPAQLRASYKFTVGDLCKMKNMSKTVMFASGVWLKSLFLASLSSILAYVSQDMLYRGQEELHRILVSVDTMASSLSFLIMLLVASYVGSTVAKWHRTLNTLLTVTGRLADLSCLVGNDLKRDPDRRIAYTFYRYLNLVHILTYRGLTEQYNFTLDDLEQSQLLEGKNERSALEQGGGNPRDIVICWIGKLMNECYRTKRMTAAFANDTFDQLCQLRGNCGFGNGLRAHEAEPASWATLMIVIVHLQMFLYSIGFAGKFVSKDPNPLTGFGPMEHMNCTEGGAVVFFASFLLVMVFAFLVELCEVMRDPLGHDYDDINGEVLLHNADITMFHYLHGGHMDITLADSISLD